MWNYKKIQANLHAYVSQGPIFRPSLNELHIAPNSFIILATMAVAPTEAEQHNKKEGPKLPLPSEKSSISTPPMTISAADFWEISSDVGAFYSDKPWKISLSSGRSPLPPLGKQKRKMSIVMSFPKKEGVSQHICKACRQVLLEGKNIPGTSRD